MSYYTIEGEEVSRQQIKEAVEKQLAVLHWSHFPKDVSQACRAAAGMLTTG